MDGNSVARQGGDAQNRRMSPAPSVNPQQSNPQQVVPHAIDRIWSAPLVPVAAAFTFGVLIDRRFDVPVAYSLIGLVLAWFAWLASMRRPVPTAGIIWLWIVVAAVGCWRNQVHHAGDGSDGIGGIVSTDPRVVRVQGRVASDPISDTVRREDPLRTFAAPAGTRYLLECRRIHFGRSSQDTTGYVQVLQEGNPTVLRVGDRVELTGRLSRPMPPANPGGLDREAWYREEGIGGLLAVPDVAGAVAILPPGGGPRLGDLVGRVRGWCREALARFVPKEEQGLAVALLLGDGSGLDEEGWNVFLRTGVIHVLAISGQHLMILAGIAWFLLRMGEVSRRWTAGVVAVVLFGYAMVTGGRPPVLRATWMVAVLVLGIFRRHPVLPANSFAVAWLGIGLVNPAHQFQFGTLLSFLAVGVLIWGTGRWERRPLDPVTRMEREQGGFLPGVVDRAVRGIVWFYLVNGAVWLAVTPLVASRQNLVAPIALLIGPPMVALSSLALVSGFATLLTAPLAEPFAQVFGWITGKALAGARGLAGWGADLPGAWFHVIDVPDWWLWVGYGGLFAALTLPVLFRYRKGMIAGGLLWAAVGLVWLGWWPHVREFRCTFLSVGHGGCIVVETPQGKTLLYDAGAMTGPEVSRRHIAPFLWWRGIRRLDEVLLSHADLDHFNGVPALLERIPVGRIGLTPSFESRDTPGAKATLEAIARRGIPVRILHAGMAEEIGGVRIEVLHPPRVGPEGKENARSLVLLIRHRGRHVLLTGDLEEPGLSQVLDLPIPRLDVLQAPHHGSPASNTEALARWARAGLAVSSQGKPRSEASRAVFEKAGSTYWTTWTRGAVTVRFIEGELVVEAHRTSEEIRLGRQVEGGRKKAD